jgi:hypothetical protein
MIAECPIEAESPWIELVLKIRRAELHSSEEILRILRVTPVSADTLQDRDAMWRVYRSVENDGWFSTEERHRIMGWILSLMWEEIPSALAD